jgi:hypothetical protein
MNQKSLSQKLSAPNAAKKVLIVVSGINHYYDQIGHRLAEAFHTLGYDATVQSISAYQPAEYDLTLLVNAFEIAVAYCRRFFDLSPAVEQIKAMKARTARIGAIVLDCVHTYWFSENYSVCHYAGIPDLYDLGFHSQHDALDAHMRKKYRFILSGLTVSERQKVMQWQTTHQERPIPWAFIGHFQKHRAQFAMRLTQSCGANGVLYLPQLKPFTEEGPHINSEQLQRILERTRYYTWIAHHDYFYMESERFRNAALAGCVPIKVHSHPYNIDAYLPFTYLMLHESDFDEQLRSFDYAEVRQRFLQDYLLLPSLEASIAQVILDTKLCE